MDIIYCFDDGYKDLAEISSNTFRKWNKNAKVHYVTKDTKNLLKEFNKDLLGYKHVSKACFLRFLIPLLFPELERALYVDCDTLCLDNIEELYNTDFENNYIIATRGHSYSDIQAKELNLPYYINSGVLLFNIFLMNKENYFKQILDNYKDAIGKPKVFSGDETIINWVFKNKIKLVPEKWNYCYKRDYGTRFCPNPKILHVIGNDKRRMYE